MSKSTKIYTYKDQSNTFEKQLSSVISNLEKKEHIFDSVMFEGRKAVRECSKSIKAIHNNDLESAEQHIKNAEKLIYKISEYSQEFKSHLNHVHQEYVEAIVLFSVVNEKQLPVFTDFNVSEISYLNGYLDAIGELKREMYEALRHGDKDKAEYFFSLMEIIYDSFLPISFSNAILPEFRRKQDVARIQIEQARGELLHA